MIYKQLKWDGLKPQSWNGYYKANISIIIARISRLENKNISRFKNFLKLIADKFRTIIENTIISTHFFFQSLSYMF